MKHRDAAKGFGGFQNFSVFSRVCSPLCSFSCSPRTLQLVHEKKNKQTHISSAKEAFVTPLLGSSYLSDFDFSSTVPLRDTWRVKGTTISPRSVGMEGYRYCGMQRVLPMASHRMDGLKQWEWREYMERRKNDKTMPLIFHSVRIYLWKLSQMINRRCFPCKYSM